MNLRLFLQFSYSRDIRDLSGFVKGGRDRVPKESTDYVRRQVAGWSQGEIFEHIDSVATRSKECLEISARNFRPPVYGEGTGAFDCEFFNYDFTVSHREDDVARCTFTGRLQVKDFDRFIQVQDAVGPCFPESFETVTCELPDRERDLKELIYTLDDNKKILQPLFDFSYANDFSFFQLIHKKKSQIIKVDEKHLQIAFKDTEAIPDMIAALTDVSQTVDSATANAHQLFLGGSETL